MVNPKSKIIFIVGPTAVGKSRIACLLAKRIDAEIISCDSMQVYKGVPILTASLSIAILKSVPHHLVSTIELSKEYNVMKFIKKAKSLINEILKRGKIPLIVGGSGLYVSGLLDGIFSGPGEDKNLREKLESQARKRGNYYLHQRLKKLDPESASEVHPNNLKRVIRALEVCIKSGQKLSCLKRNRLGIWGRGRFDVKIIGLNRSRAKIYQRIEARVESMFNKGAVKEAKYALKQELSKTSQAIIGIKEIAGFLRKEYNKDEAKRLVKRNSRRFAKRQLTWFKRDRRIRWIEIKQQDKPEDIVKRILDLL